MTDDGTLVDRCIHNPAWAAAEIMKLRDALEPFVKSFSELMDSVNMLRRFEGEQPYRDEESADGIYSWALSLTWGDLRRARAAYKSSRP